MLNILKSKEQFTDLINEDKTTLVDFYADWCGPCKMIAPIIEELASEESAVNIAKLNVDDLNEVAQEYRVSSIPTILIFKNGEVKERIVGFRPKEELLKSLNDAK